MAIRCLNPACGEVAESDAARFCPRCGAALPPPAVIDPMIGRSISDGRYRFEARLGEGSMGRVYLATQKLGASTRKVAIKIILPDLKSDPGLIERFHREIGLALQLDHPNIVRIYDSGALPDGTLFVVMEYVDGESLAQVIEAGKLPVARVEVILRQLASALSAAHEQGIVHRDLKPDNVLVARRGSRGEVVKVVDFGIARKHGGPALTQAGVVLGTPAYMSPEQFSQSEVTAMADVYALGVMTWEMLAGAHPFVAETAWEWAMAHGVRVPPPIDANGPVDGLLPRHRDAVNRALAKSPADRFASMLEFVQAFTGDPAAGSGWTEGFSTGGVGVRPSTEAPPENAPLPATMLNLQNPFASTPPPAPWIDTPYMPPPPVAPPVVFPPQVPVMVLPPLVQTPPRRRSRAPWIAGALFVLCVVAGFIGVLVLTPDPPDPAPTPRDAGARPAPPRAPAPPVPAVPPLDPAATRVFSAVHHRSPNVGLDDAELARRIARQDGTCVTLASATVTLELPAGWRFASDGNPATTDLEIHLAGQDAGRYEIAVGADHDHLRPVAENVAGELDLDVDRLGPGIAAEVRFLRVSTRLSGGAICLDSVEAVRVVPGA